MRLCAKSWFPFLDRKVKTYLNLAVVYALGYFVYDLIDLAINDLQRSYCVIIHHILVSVGIFLFFMSKNGISLPDHLVNIY